MVPYCEENVRRAPSVGRRRTGRGRTARNTPRLSRDRGHIVWFSNSSRYFPCLLFIIVNWYIVRGNSPREWRNLRTRERLCRAQATRRGRNRSDQRRGVSLREVMETRLYPTTTQSCLLYFFRHGHTRAMEYRLSTSDCAREYTRSEMNMIEWQRAIVTVVCFFYTVGYFCRVLVYVDIEKIPVSIKIFLTPMLEI